MTTVAIIAAHLAALVVWPILLVGIINRVKARWAGRRGPPLWQLGFDLWRLARKDVVRSTTTTAVFALAPWIVLAAALAGSLVVPLAGPAPLGFRYDFLLLVYLWGLGRLALMLGALDTGSPFEGMGASREATFSALAEPIFFLLLAALATTTGERTLAGLLNAHVAGPVVIALLSLAAFALLIVESARMPVDDPTTHLELTMVHEVMVLDHSGLDLSFVQHAAALKTFLWAQLIVALVVPLEAGTFVGVAARFGALVGIAFALGLVESLIARLKLRGVPAFLAAALVLASVALVIAVVRA